MRIDVDRDVCVGAGQCVLTAPELFDQSHDDGRVVLRERQPSTADSADSADAADAAEAAVNLCPARALRIVSE